MQNEVQRVNIHNDQDNVIDQNLREAYGQIQFRDEWAERVLRKLADESEQLSTLATSHVSESRPGSSSSRLVGRRTLALAATIFLVAVGAYWLATNAQRPSPSRSMDSEIAKRLTLPSENLSELQGDSGLREVSQPSAKSYQQTDPVTATPGYLAAKLTDDPEFEIYMVLPKNTTNKF